MTTSAPRRTRVRLAVAALLAATAAGATAHSGAAKPAEPVVPAKIAVPAGNKPFLVGYATGVQVYACGPTASGFGWSFVAPRASLYDDHGKLLTTHFAGPTWQAKDGSAVVGSVVDRHPVGPTAIPWLLLSATPTAVGEDGRLSATTYIQRLDTSGGVAPAAAECTAGSSGAIAEVPYTATYYFWKRANAG